MPLDPIDWVAPEYVRTYYGYVVHHESTESRWCPSCQRYRITFKDICNDCGSNT